MTQYHPITLGIATAIVLILLVPILLLSIVVRQVRTFVNLGRRAKAIAVLAMYTVIATGFQISACFIVTDLRVDSRTDWILMLFAALTMRAIELSGTGLLKLLRKGSISRGM
jgi:hypothetical protein